MNARPPACRRALISVAIFFASFVFCSFNLLAQTVGKPVIGEKAVSRTTGEMMADPEAKKARPYIYLKKEHRSPDRENLPQDAKALPEKSFPRSTTRKFSSPSSASAPAPRFAQTVGTSFDGAVGPTETNAFPPDSMGAVGPAQFILFVNGRLRSFDKATGFDDGVLDINPDFFFTSVVTPSAFTTDPQIRYDRLTKRWILAMIDVPSSSPKTTGDLPNRLLFAVSDAASNGVITSSTVWSFYYVQQDTLTGVSTGEFLDYESLGVDANALYVGGDMFGAKSGAFITTSAFVVKKSSILNGGPIVVTAFRDIKANGGPSSPRGVDNFDAGATEGYFIGASATTLGQLVLRRVSDPGGTPAISDNIPVTVNTTANPQPVPHSGNSVLNGRLDALDDRLFAAHIRNGKLWTAHTISVGADGIATSSDAQRRDAVRWYELTVPASTGTPTISQSGTIFDTAVNVADAHQYWMASIMVSGQGHAALGFSAAGTAFFANAASSGRLLSDAPGVLDAPTFLTAAATAYTPSSDSGSADGRRWGDYSFTSVDPEDDMTMWTVQEWCSAKDSYALHVAKLVAPPPASPSSASTAVPAGLSSTNVSITGSVSGGSGFFDPGSGFAKHLSASVTGGVVVNSVTYVDPTHVDLDLNTSSAAEGAKDVTITNPDGQARVGTAILTVGAGSGTPTPSPSPSATATPTPTPTPIAYAEITDPTPGTTLPSSTATFRWTAGSSATSYALTVGNSAGSSEYANTGQISVLSSTVSGLPQDGRTVYVRLTSYLNGTAYNPPQDYTYTAQIGAVSTPTISPSGGSFRRRATVSLSDATPGTTIYYTLDGTTPTTLSQIYTAPFSIGGRRQTITVKAIATKAGIPDSGVAIGSFRFR